MKKREHICEFGSFYETMNTSVRLGKLRASHFSSEYEGVLSEEAPLAALHRRSVRGQISLSCDPVMELEPFPHLGALMLCIKPTSSLPVLQILSFHYEIRYV